MQDYDERANRNEEGLRSFSNFHLKIMSEKISEVRKDIQMTNVKLSNLSGLSRVTVRRIQNQTETTVKPNMDAFLRVCMVLKIDPSLMINTNHE